MTDTPSSNLVRKESCPACGSRDNLARYDDGHGFCFGCNHYEPGTDTPPTRRKTMASSDLLQGGTISAIKSRGLTSETCAKWKYEVAYDGYTQSSVQVANYCDDTGAIVAQKIRTKDKNFSVRGKISGLLYGAHLWRNGGRRIVVCEGEIDAMTVSQCFEHKWPVVSIPNGAAAARKSLSLNLEFLNKFEAVVLCFDQDEPGRKAVEDCVSLFPPGKVKSVILPLKDPNEMLLAGRVEELIRCLWDAKDHRPDGIVKVADVIEEALREPTKDLSWCLPKLDEATYGRRFGEAVAVGAGTGIGKTTFLTQQIAHDLTEGEAVAVFAFEQMPGETVKRVAGQMVGQTFHIPGSGWTQDHLAKVLRSDLMQNLYLYDHFGACDWNIVRERMRYLNHAHGVRVFYLDHLTALAAAEEDERKGLEKIMSELGGIVKELKCWLLFVSHLATPDGTPHEEGGRVTIRHFKGSRAIGYWSHFMFGLERDQQSDDPNDRGRTVFRVLKDRFTGQSTGLTIPLSYDTKTGLLAEAVDNPFSAPTETEAPF